MSTLVNVQIGRASKQGHTDTMDVAELVGHEGSPAVSYPGQVLEGYKPVLSCSEDVFIRLLK